MENSNMRQNQLPSDHNKTIDAIKYMIDEVGIEFTSVQEHQLLQKIAGKEASRQSSVVNQAGNSREQMSASASEPAITHEIKTGVHTALSTSSTPGKTKKVMKVEFADGTTFESTTIVNVWRDVIYHIGIDTLQNFCNGRDEFWITEQRTQKEWGIIDSRRRGNGKYQYRAGKYYIYKNFSPEQMMKKLAQFSYCLAEHCPDLAMTITLKTNKRN